MASIGNLRGSEICAVVATLDPVTMANVEKTTDWVDVGSFESVMFILLTGDMASETIDFKLEQATSSGGAGKKDLVVATQLAASAAANDGGQIILETRAEELDQANGYRFVRASGVTGGATGGPAAIIGLGVNARYGVGTDLSTVAQITHP
jgi:hypothetical protein